MLTIITGNKNKFEDLRVALAPMQVTHMSLDLDEIQALDPKQIIEHKLRQAHLQVPNTEFLIDDRSLSVEGLNGLPGPFVKWFLETVGAEGIYRMAKAASTSLPSGHLSFQGEKNNDNAMKATARAWVGYCSSGGEYHFFEGVVPGIIVPVRGELDYGWGPIFQPEGSGKTFGEMTKAEKAPWSHYGKALEKFKEFYVNYGRQA